MKEFEEKERLYENGIAHRYNDDYHRPPIMSWHSSEFVKFVGAHFRTNDRVLDLGCGPASLWQYFESELKGAETIVGVDLSEGMLEQARKSFPRGDFRVGSMFEIPAESGSFDLVIVSSAFHHIPDSDLPAALLEVHRVLDEHGLLVGREPLASGRLGDRGGWFSGALMSFRHLVYRLTHTREYPEPEPGPHHHAYDASEFLSILSRVFGIKGVESKNPVSPFVARAKSRQVKKVAQMLDEAIGHKEGQEIRYVATKNFSDSEDVRLCIERYLIENKVQDLAEFSALLIAASEYLEKVLAEDVNIPR